VGPSIQVFYEGFENLRLGVWMISPLNRAAIAFAVLVGLQHIGFFILETFLWEKPVGLKFFRLTPEKAAITAPLAKNQGVYNAFLAAGLFWGLATVAMGGLGYEEFSRAILTFFFGCVLVAGIVGALTVNKRIFVAQGLPALVGLLLVRLG
jgi:putative membrane protein